MSSGTETFTGADGSAAQSPWLTNKGTGGPTWNIQSNQHRAVGILGYVGAGLTYGTTVVGTTTITCDITIPVTRQESYPGIGYRLNGGTAGWDPTYFEPYNGYDAFFDVLGNIFVWNRTSAGSIVAADSVAFTTSASTQYTIKVVVSGSNHQLSAWATAGSPPGSPQMTETDATISTGWWGIRAQQNTTSTMDYDNITWNDDAGGAAGKMGPVGRRLGLPAAILNR